MLSVRQAGWVGKGKKPGEDAASEHVSRPLSTLKDPSSFGPPPKNVNYHGGAALPNEITPHRGGIGAPLTQEQIQSANRAVHNTPDEAEAEPIRAGPALPYRANTTGLATAHLPPPPVRRGQSAVEPSQTVQPRLPPRLPARQSTSESIPTTTAPPPSYEATTSQPPAPVPSTSLNQSAMNRLGKAGVNVPGLGIGRTSSSPTIPESNPWKSEKSQTTTSGSNTMSELQSRFSRMNSGSQAGAQAQASPSPSPAPPPTLQQTQSAFTTAQKFNQDPSSISVNDAKNAANTANNGLLSASAFKDKHAGSIAVAEQRGKSFNNKYQIQNRFERFLDKHAPLEDQQEQAQAQGAYQTPGQPQQQLAPTPPSNGIQSPSPELAASISRKPPPPPPPKKPSGLHGNSMSSPPPPPVPLGTKPSYS